MSNHLSDRSADPATLVELLRRRAQQQPDQLAYTFLVDGETSEARLTYGELDQQARAIAALLQGTDAVGERALLLYPPGLDYIAAFFGCLYAGVVVVPAYPPDPTRLDRTLPRLRAIITDARPALALTTSQISMLATALGAQDAAVGALHWLATDAIMQDQADAWQSPQLESSTLAFLQYTSGSTATPKGVMLTHGNLLHNSALIKHGFGHTTDSRGVIWLPPYHDMGLIGGIIQPLYAGFPVTLLSPIAFLQRPLRWLQAISHYRATTSGGPNFAYDLCVRKVTPEQRASLDLSSWTVAFNGAEPIRPDTLDRFAATFEMCGFRREAFYPCYGLAEATLIVSGGSVAATPITQTFDSAKLDQHEAVAADPAAAGSRTMVGCGAALPEQLIDIVDPEALTTCAPGRVGEVWVAGPSVAQGYWERPDETAQTFNAVNASRPGRAFLRTGDLGFMQDGELFITGRIKDLIIIRGRNQYPQDIELTVERCHPALRPGSGAAFAVPVDGEERLVVVQEVERQARDLDVETVAGAIRQAVAAQHEVQVYAVVLLAAGSIPKTSSGKIQRHACRAAFIEGRLTAIGTSILDAVAADAPAPAPDARAATADAAADTPAFSGASLRALAEPERASQLTAYLRSRMAQILQVDPAQLDPQQPLSAFGLDSLLAVELQHAIESDLGATLPMAQLLQGGSIADIAQTLLPQLAVAPTPAQPLPAPTDETDQPLSRGQRALWFLHQLAPESAAYNIARAARIRGDLDVAALRRAFQALVDRHPALRTSFPAPAGEPIQQVLPHADVAFAVQDATRWSAADMSARLVNEAERPFDLAQGPLLRISVFKRAANEHVLLLVVHHMVADLWSLAVLMQELATLYPAERAGRTTTQLAPLALGYADYVRRQDAMLASPAGAQLENYWLRTLAGELPILNLPTDRPRPLVQTYRGAAQSFTLDADVTQQIKALAQAGDATLYTTLLAAFVALLGRYTGQDDLVVGTPTAGRSRAELSGLVGYFVNPLALRANLAGDPPFTELLARMRATVLAALEHQEYPFPLLVERLQPQRDASRSPLFQVMFVLQKAPQLDAAGVSGFALGETGTQMTIGELPLESLALEQRVEQFDLTLLLAEVDGRLAGTFQYNTDLFDATTIARLVGHFQTVIAGVVADPTTRITDLPLLTAAEQAQVHEVWNASAADYPHDAAVHTLFEAQAARTPDAVAVVFAGQVLTYGALNARANQLAHALIARGVGPDTLVALCAERSLAMLVGIIGILKAGGAYVPLDPAYPPERLTFMLDDTQTPVLVTAVQDEGRRTKDESADASFVIRHSSFVTRQVVDLIGNWPMLAGYPTDNPLRRVTSDQRAYVIYTSGSTGRPKGVMVLQSGLLNLAYGLRAFFDDPAIAAVGLITSISFDISINQIFPTLLFGRALHIIPEDVKFNSAALMRYAHAHGLNVLDAVPSYMQAVLRDLAPARLPNAFRYLLIGGEPLDPALVQQIFAQLGAQVAVVNIYGLSEISDVNTFAVLTANERDAPVTIGMPLQNNQLYILNPRWQLQPIGVVGELCIAGASLSRGYLNRPELTAERFVPNPFAEVSGIGYRVLGAEPSDTRYPTPATRMCATGDLGRWRADGRIELLGRIDHQVKVRGFRIEVGEIETLLALQPGVRECAVVVRADEPGDTRLVAYIVPVQAVETQYSASVQGADDPASPTPEARPLIPDLRAALKQQLPEYMVPSAFVLLDALPKTPNGKLDRRALPAPDLSSAPLETAYVAPRTPTEETVAGIWALVLRRERVGIHDNFFELGGHSLLATQVLYRVRETFQIELPLHTIFMDPTVASMAQAIDQSQPQQKKELPTIQARPRGNKSVAQLLAKLDQLSESEIRELLMKKDQ